MAYTSLYRKYRPSGFDEVIGQDAVVRTLRNMISGQNIAHAYLFTGTRGTGKTSVARIFAKAVNCMSPVDGSPCGQCAACRVFSTGANMDLIELDAASNNSIDDIRALRDSSKYPPADPSLRYKVYIIDEVHQLSLAAFNAFLKTLEEPPEFCIFILATTEVQKLPQTILSRCLRFDFRSVSQDLLAEHVGRVYDREQVTYDRDALWAIAAAGNGSVRDTLSVADTCMSASGGNVTYPIVLQVLGANDPAVIAGVVRAILQGDLSTALSMVERSVTAGKSVPVLTRDVTKYIRDLLIIKADPKANEYLRLPQSAFETARDIAAGVDSAVMVRALAEFSGLDGSMRLSTSPRTVLESAIAHTATFAGQSYADVLARVAHVEEELIGCRRQLASGVVTVATQSMPQSSAGQDEATTQAEATDTAVSTDSLTEVTDPFAEEPVAKAEPIRTTPDDYMSSHGVSIKYKGNLIAKLRERKMFVLYTMVDSSFVDVKDKTVTFNLSSKSDEKYCEDTRALFEALTVEILGEGYQLVFKYVPPKKTDADGLSQLESLLGANKITKKS